LRPPDFESGASASSATPGQHLKISRRRPTLKKLWSAAALLPLFPIAAAVNLFSALPLHYLCITSA
jgi:hypothetical protein